MRQGKRKRWFALSMGSCMLAATFIGTSGTYAQENSQSISRGEFVQAVVQHLQLKPGASGISLPSDVPGESRYADSIRSLKERKIVNGYPDGTFKPDRPITAAEAAIILGNVLGIPAKEARSLLEQEYGLSFADPAKVNGREAAQAIQSVLRSDPSAYERMQQSSAAQLQQTSYRANLQQDILIKMDEQTAETNPFQINADINMEFHKDQGIRMAMTTKLPQPLPDGSKEMTMEQYIVPDGVYMQLPNPETGQNEWVKMGKDVYPFSFQQLMDMQNNSIGINRDMMEQKHVFYRDLGKDQLQGKEVHKIGFRARFTSLEEMLGMFNQNLPGEVMQQLQAGPAMGSLVTSGTLWIDPDSKLPVQMDQVVNISYAPSKDMPLGEMELHIRGTYSDFNQVKEIKLPEAAKAAKEMEMPAQAEPLQETHPETQP